MTTTRTTFKPLHMMLATIMLVLAAAALAACGDATSTGAITQPTATLPTEAAPTPTMTAMEDMEMAPTTEAAPTTAPDQAGEGDTSTATPSTSTSGDAGTVTEVQATLREWAIDLSRQEVPAGKIRFTVTNQSRMQHNLTVTSDSGTLDKTSNFTSSDGPQTLEVDLQPGTYTLICDLPGHAQRGQRIELTVK